MKNNSKSKNKRKTKNKLKAKNKPKLKMVLQRIYFVVCLVSLYVEVFQCCAIKYSAT